ncbi:type II secretion system F family protein [Gorillibacterium sp. sgz500922]|uniref:type II secretion system F family protein n=1 Tax=Gorillibacterium sp. sgz500922 TaxID=3446694 RepID=UPI003F67CDA9
MNTFWENRAVLNGFMAFILLLWSASMYFFWRYNLSRIRLRQELGLIKKREKRKRTGKEKLKEGIVRGSILFAPVGRRFRLFVNEEDIRRKIMLAGTPYGFDLDAFYGLRYLCVLAGALAGALLMFVGFNSIFLLLFVLAGLFAPTMWIRSAAQARQETIGLQLPDFMDAMSVTLQAGAPLDPATKQIVQGMDGPLAEEMTRHLQELDMGVPREDAYMRLMARNDCKELETLVLSLIQGSKLGVPIAATFKNMSEDIREARIGRIREKAAKASPKVTLITTFLIVPGVLLCILGMLALNLIYNPEAMGIDLSLFK